MGTSLTTPEAMVAEVRELVSLPEIALQVSAMVDDPRYSTTDIGNAIGRDPSLTVRLLRIANSPYFGLASKVGTINRAVTVIGTKPLRDLIIATCAMRSFKGLPNQLVSMDDFWYHSLYCAIAARALALRRRLMHADSLFVAGLLHDIGQLIIYSRAPEAALEALRLSLEDPRAVDMHQAEREVLGFDHAQVGGLLLKHWRLPALIEEPVTFHHNPTAARQFPMETAILHIANVLATMAEINSLNPDDVPEIQAAAWKQAGTSEDVVEQVVRDCQHQFREARLLFLADIA